MKLTASFYTRPDVVQLSRELIGKVLCTRIDGLLCEAIITETEAYAGVTDRASHAYGGRRSRRTEVMYLPGGHAYIYLCYGMYSLFNVVTNGENIPHAVLIRGAQPLTGADAMCRRRKRNAPTDDLLNGPGKLAAAMGLHYSLTGTSLAGPVVWIEDRGIKVPRTAIAATPRVGVDDAGDDAKRRWRFVVRDARWLR
jgi:DNA-3-methyladenine glycosylase